MARLFLSVALLLATGCALRPRYNDVMPPTSSGAEARLLLVEKASGRPLPGVPVELGEGKARATRLTDEHGVFVLPVDAKLKQDNPMLVVTLPAGVAGYEVKAGPPPAQQRPLPSFGIPLSPDSGGTTDEVKPDQAPASEEAPVETDGGTEPVTL